MSPKTAFPGRSAGAAGLSGSAVGNNPKNGRWRVAGGGRKRPVPALVPPHREDSELQTLLRPLSTLRNAAGEKCGLDDLSQRLVDGFERVRSFKERRQGSSAASLLDGICQASVTLGGSLAERDANVAFRNAISLRAEVARVREKR